MATKIRFKRIGRKNRPFYRLVVIDSRKRRDGAPIEQLGWYDPIKADKESNFSFNEDKIIDWLKEGAQVSDSVNKLMKRSGLAYKWHLIKQGLSESEIEKALKKWKEERDEVVKNRKKARLDKKIKKKEEKASKKLVEEAPVEEAPAEEVVEEEAPAEEVVEEAPVEEVVEEAPAEEPVAEAPAEEPAAEEAPVEEAPAEEVVEEAPAEEKS